MPNTQESLLEGGSVLLLPLGDGAGVAPGLSPSKVGTHHKLCVGLLLS